MVAPIFPPTTATDALDFPAFSPRSPGFGEQDRERIETEATRVSGRACASRQRRGRRRISARTTALLCGDSRIFPEASMKITVVLAARPNSPALRSSIFSFDLRHGQREIKRSAPAKMALLTLRRMAAGGMRDHLGGGFHRYSVDEFWHVPHFEKMLYDQAQLAVSFLEAWQLTRDEFFAGDRPRGARLCVEGHDASRGRLFFGGRR